MQAKQNLVYQMHANQNYTTLAQNLRLNHIYKSVTFGDARQHRGIEARFGESDTDTSASNHVQFDLIKNVDSSLMNI